MKRRIKVDIQEWNADYPEGTLVKFFPVTGQPEFEVSRTRSVAWLLGHGDAVVLIEGRSGGVALSNIEIVED